MPLDVSHQLESIELNTRLSSQGSQSLIRQNDPSMSRLLQVVPLDVIPDEANRLRASGHTFTDDSLQDRVAQDRRHQILESLVGALVSLPLDFCVSQGPFRSAISSLDKVVSVVEF